MRALFTFHTVDERDLNRLQTGVYYADGQPKASRAPLRNAIRAVERGVVARCPGLRLRPSGVRRSSRSPPRRARGRSRSGSRATSTAGYTARVMALAPGTTTFAVDGRALGRRPRTISFEPLSLTPGRYRIVVSRPGRRQRRRDGHAHGSGSRRSGDDPAVILDNGVIRTMDASLPLARALAIAGDRIVGGVGTHETALASPERVDLRGRCVLPGFTDSHTHFPTWALARSEVRLEGTRTLDEALERVAAGAAGRRARRLAARPRLAERRLVAACRAVQTGSRRDRRRRARLRCWPATPTRSG